MKISDLGPLYAPQLLILQKVAQEENLWKQTASSLLAADPENTAAFLSTLHQAQRVYKVAVAGLENDDDFFEAALKQAAPLWSIDNDDLPASADQQKNLACKIYNLRPGMNDTGFVRIGTEAPQVGAHLVQQCLDNKDNFIIDFIDPPFNALVLNHASAKGIKALSAAYVETNKKCNRSMILSPGTPKKKPPRIQKRKAQLYNKGLSSVSNRASTGDLFYTLTAIPSRKDAKIDGMRYKDYIKLFFDMCDQPWHEIDKAQQALIQEFNVASRVRITNNDGTDVSMELIDHDGRHFTFCNSLIAKNVPGSEIFSAPRIDSLEGNVVAKGKFEHGSKVMENLRLEFKKGVLVSYTAEKGQDELDRILSADEGTKRVGELGIGTNPHLKQHVSNGLLVEKIGGSFHIALGRAYQYTEYGGEPVHVNNGNKSHLHWDVTTMLHGKEGRIYLDDRLVMDDGKWLDQKYDVLNRGWAALPEDQRPQYWRKKLRQKPAA